MIHSEKNNIQIKLLIHNDTKRGLKVREKYKEKMPHKLSTMGNKLSYNTIPVLELEVPR